VLGRLFGPIVDRLARALSRIMDRTGEERLLLRLRHAGLFAHVPIEQRTQEYRVRQLAGAVLGGALSIVAGIALGWSTRGVLAVGALGLVVGVTRWRARVDKAIGERQERMRIELYTVNQLFAMHLRTGGGSVVRAMRDLIERGRGVVVEEFTEALHAIESGATPADALKRQGELTVEPAAERTYRLLASGVEHGVDLAEALLELSEDIRDARREALRRAATRRRAAMLIPTICVLAPPMLLFIGAPLPSLVFGKF
jgi:Flp pilus assembly protein TadB